MMSARTLKMLDTTKHVTLSALSKSRMSDPLFVELSEQLRLPQLLNLSAPTQGAEELNISDAAGFIDWLQSNAWATRFEVDLQCISEDQAGLSLLTTWISLSEFKQLVLDAEGTAFDSVLRNAGAIWENLGADEISLDGYLLDELEV